MTAPALTHREVCAREAAHAFGAYSVGLIVAPAGVRVQDVRETNAAGVAHVGAYHGGAPPLRSIIAVLAAGNLYAGIGHAGLVGDKVLADGIRIHVPFVHCR